MSGMQGQHCFYFFVRRHQSFIWKAALLIAVTSLPLETLAQSKGVRKKSKSGPAKKSSEPTSPVSPSIRDPQIAGATESIPEKTAAVPTSHAGRPARPTMEQVYAVGFYGPLATKSLVRRSVVTLGYGSSNYKSSSNNGESSKANVAGPALAVSGVFPVDRLTIVPSFSQLSYSGKSTSSGSTSSTTKFDLNTTTLALDIGIRLPGNVDAEIAVSKIDESDRYRFSSGSTKIKSSYSRSRVALGYQGSVFETSLEYKPQVTATREFSSDGFSGESEKVVPSVLTVGYRHFFPDSLYAGPVFSKTSSDHNNETMFAIDLGFLERERQLSLALSSTSRETTMKDDPSYKDKDQIMSATALAMFGDERRSRYGGAIFFSSESGKESSSGSKSTGSNYELTALGSWAF